MKLELLVTTPCLICQQAQDVWERIAAKHGLPLDVIDISSTQGEAIMARLALKTVPAIVVNGSLKGVGVQSNKEANRIIETIRCRET